MDAITSIIPVPRPVPIEAAGVTLQADELTLRDLAELQAVLDSLLPDPLAAAGREIAQATGDERRRLLLAAYHAADAGPGIYGEPSGRPHYATTEGIAFLIWVACRRHTPGLTPAVAAEIARVMKPWEFSSLWRIAHGQPVKRTLEQMLSPFPPSTGAAPAVSLTWGKVIEEVVEAHPGWTYADVYDLTISEFANARRGGKPPSDGIPVPAGMDPVEALRLFREAFTLPAAADSAEPPPDDGGPENQTGPDDPLDG